jgi:hypothetical protein
MKAYPNTPRALRQVDRHRTPAVADQPSEAHQPSEFERYLLGQARIVMDQVGRAAAPIVRDLVQRRPT